MPLSYTPRKFINTFITHPGDNYFYMIEGDHRVMLEDATARARLAARYWCLWVNSDTDTEFEFS
jgi:splicing factor 3B subunit 3